MIVRFLLDAEPMVARGPNGKPSDIVAKSLARRLNADVQLWPNVEPSPHGETYRAQWFDRQTEEYREGLVLIT